MKSSCAIFAMLCALATSVAGYAAPVATTAGSNLTAWNASNASVNNNNWNSMTNGRSSGTSAGAPVNFGNCNSVIMRCAQPKCSSGGCTDMNIAATIVAGCVQSNETCKQYGDDLVQYISAQLVASSTARVNEQAAQAAAAASAASAANSASQAQMQQMAAQMQNMQAQMQQQNYELQAALSAQQQATAQAIADAAAAAVANNTSANMAAAESVTSVAQGLTVAQEIAAQNGVSADLLMRQQLAGEVLSEIENAEAALAELKRTMVDAFSYAGCDAYGNGCSGPRRVKVFKEKAMNFFDPYTAVLDSVYDALITAQSVGVDITDVYMMLNDSCNRWGEYLCAGGNYTIETYDKDSCPNGRSVRSAYTKGGAECKVGWSIPAEDDVRCTLNRPYTNQEEIFRNWLDEEAGGSGHIRVGCASSALDNSRLFAGRKEAATIDIETLERIIAQDAPSVPPRNSADVRRDVLKYCAVNDESFDILQKAVNTKSLPGSVCVTASKLNNDYSKLATPVDGTVAASSVTLGDVQRKCENTGGLWLEHQNTCYCDPKIYLNGECVEPTEGNRKLWNIEKSVDESLIQERKDMAAMEKESYEAWRKENADKLNETNKVIEFLGL